MKEKRDPNALYCDDPSLTKQSFREECDINEILRRASNGQDISSAVSSRVAQFGDFTNIPDFQESMNIVTRANSAFMQLPWETRERFSNDPARMIEFLQHEDNYDEAVELGLLDKDLVEARRAKAKEAEASAAADRAEGESRSESRPKHKAKARDEDGE